MPVSSAPPFPSVKARAAAAALAAMLALVAGCRSAAAPRQGASRCAPVGR